HLKRARVFMIHEQAMRANPGDPQLQRRCADLAMELERYSEARQYLDSIVEKVVQDLPDQSADAKVAELEEQAGKCALGLADYTTAKRRFEHALEHDSKRVLSSYLLARLNRIELRDTEKADETIREMVKKNPEAGRAYMYRWLYAQQFLPSADPR